MALATTCKRSHVDELNGAPVGPFCVRIEIEKQTCIFIEYKLYNELFFKNVHTFYIKGKSVSFVWKLSFGQYAAKCSDTHGIFRYIEI